MLLAGCGGSASVIDYNDTLVDLSESCFTAENLMRDALEAENYGTAKNLLQGSVDMCTQSLTDTQAMEAYEEDASLRDAVALLLQNEIAYLQKLSETTIYRDIPEADWTEDLESQYTTLQTELGELEVAAMDASDALLATQESFATAHGYELEPTASE
jgi:hypothetical protein